MSFDDDSRIVVKEGKPPPPRTSSQPTSSKETRKSTGNLGAGPPPSPSSRGLNGGGSKTNVFGTVACVHTFPTGLVVSTGSDGTVSLGRGVVVYLFIFWRRLEAVSKAVGQTALAKV